MQGTPGEKRRTAHGSAVRTKEGWTWSCDYCHTTTSLGMASDATLFDSARWLALIDKQHHCEHKPKEH